MRTSPIAGQSGATEADQYEADLFRKHFRAEKYIRTYYPSIFDAEMVHRILTLVQQHFKKHKALSVRLFAKQHRVEDELIENVAIFDFQRIVAHKLVAEYPNGGATILDIGGGPTVYQHIALAPWARSITHAEFLEENRRAVTAWVEAIPTAHNWDNYFLLVQHMLRNDRYLFAKANKVIKSLLKAETPDLLKRHVRSRLRKRIVFGDVFAPNLHLPKRRFDVVTTNFVIESATSSFGRWEAGMHNAIERVRPGGLFVQTAITNSRWYAVGEAKLPATAITERDVRALCRKEKLAIETLRVLTESDYAHTGYEGMVFLVARRTM